MANRTYRYFTGTPLYPFGYGLSYSKFTYSSVKLSAKNLQAGKPLNVDANVKNTGPRDGDEVVEVYLTFPKLPGAPIRALRGFTRMHIAAGKTAHVHLALNPRDLSYVNENGDRVIAPGSYSLSIGGGQPGTAAPVVESGFTITGQTQLPE
jgi:beta-glucosidase